MTFPKGLNPVVTYAHACQLERELNSAKAELAAMTSKAERLSRALDAATDVGVYPKAVIGNGKGDYESRTERMEGWNECAKAVIASVCEVLQDDVVFDRTITEADIAATKKLVDEGKITDE